MTSILTVILFKDVSHSFFVQVMLSVASNFRGASEPTSHVSLLNSPSLSFWLHFGATTRYNKYATRFSHVVPTCRSWTCFCRSLCRRWRVKTAHSGPSGWTWDSCSCLPQTARNPNVGDVMTYWRKEEVYFNCRGFFLILR